MTSITDEIINNTPNDYNLFILLKKNMIKGEIRLPNLSSKNRSLLHKICYNYGLEHFSTGNYKNRTIIIKDPQHTYFSIPSMHTNDDSNIGLVQDKGMFMGFQQVIEENRKKKEELDEIEEDEGIEDEDEEEEVNTDTYSSDESECSDNSSSNSYQILQYANISNQLNTLRMFSYINLVMNVIIICNL